MRARPLLHATVAALALGALAGCQQPTPGLTVTSGSSSAHSEATVYCRSGQRLADQDCVQHLRRAVVVHVKQGALVGFDVDSAVSKHGWDVYDPAARASSGVIDSHYWSYTPQFGDGAVVNLEVRSLDRLSKDAKVTGVWRVVLVQG